MLEIKFGVIVGFGRSVEEVRDERNRISILASDDGSPHKVGEHHSSF